MRIDKWLWAARFCKTRSLASDAVSGGKVKVNGTAVKPAKELKLGDRLEIRIGKQRWEVLVSGFNGQRRPAEEARLLYQETPASVEERTRALELRQLAPSALPECRGRPTKRDGRQIRRLKAV